MAFPYSGSPWKGPNSNSRTGKSPRGTENVQVKQAGRVNPQNILLHQNDPIPVGLCLKQAFTGLPKEMFQPLKKQKTSHIP